MPFIHIDDEALDLTPEQFDFLVQHERLTALHARANPNMYKGNTMPRTGTFNYDPASVFDHTKEGGATIITRDTEPGPFVLMLWVPMHPKFPNGAYCYRPFKVNGEVVDFSTRLAAAHNRVKHRDIVITMKDYLEGKW
jgi:hypothetical protein